MKDPIYPKSIEDPLTWDEFYLTKFDDPDNTLDLDWETYYDKNTYSVATLGAVAYANDERANFYLLSAKGTLDGKPVRWAGHPSQFPHWGRLRNGPPVRLTSANSEFDETVTWAYLAHVLEWPWEDIRKIQFLCTLDLSRFNTLSGRLVDAVADAGLAETLPPIDKDVRDRMEGYSPKEDETIDPEYVDYCLVDADASSAIWGKHHRTWPDFERWYSVFNRRRNVRGLPINRDLMEESIQKLGQVVFMLESQIPWDWEGKHKTPTARQYIDRECRKVGIVPPESLAEKDAANKAFEKKYGEKYPWIIARRDWAKANRRIEKLRSMQGRTSPIGLMSFEQRYFGAHTGRAAGGRGKGDVSGGAGAGVNMQNLAKHDFYGVNERHVIAAPPGFVFFIADYSQIEPRLLYFRAGMERILSIIRSGVHIYEAHARLTMGYNDPRPLKVAAAAEPELYEFLYNLAKARVIGLGYGCGGVKFVTLAEGYGLKLTIEKSKELVNEFRDAHPEIREYWNGHDQWLTVSARNQDPTHEVELISGRNLRYFNPRMGSRTVVYDGETKIRWSPYIRPTPRAEPVSIWGGTLTENEIQATAMDVLRTGLSQLDLDLQKRFLLDVHDEVVFCFPEAQAESLAREVHESMTDIPWLPKDFPLEMSQNFTDHYLK
jgi:hypothetical protein